MTADRSGLDDLGLVDIEAFDADDGGLDDEPLTQFPRPAGYRPRAELLSDDHSRRLAERHDAELRDAYDTAALAPATREKYERNWQAFAGFMNTRYRLDPLDADSLHVRAWVVDLEQHGRSISTIEGHVAAIRWQFDWAGQSLPVAGLPTTMKAMRRQVGAAQRKALPLMLHELRRIVAGIPTFLNLPATHHRVKRDRALLTLGWAAALRVSNIVALDIDDIRIHGNADTGEGGALIYLGGSKTDQERAGRTIGVPFSTNLNSCPVRSTLALTRHLNAAGVRSPDKSVDYSSNHRRRPPATSTRPLFRNDRGHLNPDSRLTRQAVDQLIKFYAAQIGIPPGDVSTHSLRRGFVTECSNHNINAETIRRVTGHKDIRTLLAYDAPLEHLRATPLHNQNWW